MNFHFQCVATPAAAEPGTTTPRQDGQTSSSTAPMDSQQTTETAGKAFLTYSAHHVT